MNNTVELLKREFKNNQNVIVSENVPMNKYTTFKTGGIAAGAVFPTDTESMRRTLEILNGTKYSVLGNGSNVIFTDGKYDGVVVFTLNMKDTRVDGNMLEVQCGAGITRASVVAQKHSLGGLEFAYGIPGTAGGAVYMNAGAYDGEISQVLYDSTFITKDGNVGILSAEQHEFSYRHSAYVNSDKIILSCRFCLTESDADAVKAKMDENMSKRIEKQPLEYPSAGSVFKRPENAFAGKLISDCGLKGYAIGGAQVSPKHAGFIINTGNATSNDILKLIEYVRNEVIRQFGIELECEVRYIC